MKKDEEIGKYVVPVIIPSDVKTSYYTPPLKGSTTSNTIG
jgi:hypothetical protein